MREQRLELSTSFYEHCVKLEQGKARIWEKTENGKFISRKSTREDASRMYELSNYYFTPSLTIDDFNTNKALVLGKFYRVNSAGFLSRK